MSGRPSSARQSWDALRRCGLPDGGLWSLLAAYLLLTPLSALLDGLAWLQLVRLVAAAAGPQTGLLTPLLDRLGEPTPAATGALFILKGVVTAALIFIETAMGAVIRRRVQTTALERLVFGRWDALSGQHVGRWTGALTEEAAMMTKLVIYAVSASYSLLTAGLLTAMAVAAAPSFALGLAAVALPAWLALRAVYGLQSRFSKEQADARQALAGDLTESLSGLFQAKASGEGVRLARRALRRQAEVFLHELRIGGTAGLLAAFNPLVMGAALIGLAAWGAEGGLAQLGSVGVLAFRAAASVNVLVAAIGNLTRTVGSVQPVHDLLTVPPERTREPLGERLASARLEAVSYAHAGRRVLHRASLTVSPGRLLLVTGPSGAGKTTIVNLLAGLYEPAEGRVVYRGVSGAEHDASGRSARVGYVAQDVHLFSGTVRENLDAAGSSGDDVLWRSLERAGAAGFVRARGGLDAVLAEAGRSLSGGERRRLAVARALAQETDLLALDEVTNGLDEASKTALVASIAELAKELPVVAVTHDAAAFAPADPLVFSLAAGSAS